MIFSRNKYKKLKKIKNQSRKHCKKRKRHKNKKRRKRRTFRNKNYINLHNKTVKKLKGGNNNNIGYRRKRVKNETEVGNRIKEIDKEIDNILASQSSPDKFLVRVRDTANKFGLVLPQDSKIKSKGSIEAQYNFEGKYSSKNPLLEKFGNEVIIHIPNPENKNKFTVFQTEYDSGGVEAENIRKNHKRIGYAMGLISVDDRILKLEI